MKHKHCEVIKAWADGAEVQSFCTEDKKWITLASPFFWNPEHEYRIKPPAPKWPKTTLTERELDAHYDEVRPPYDFTYTTIANYALSHALETGQVVLPDSKLHIRIAEASAKWVSERVRSYGHNECADYIDNYPINFEKIIEGVKS